MFIGHLGVGMAGKKLSPKTSLGTLLLAAQFVDLLWPLFLLIGLEEVSIVPGITVVTPLDFVHYPITHSLLTGILWAILFGVTYFGFTRYAKGAFVAGTLVLSHWVLDFVSHRPDLPLTPFTESKVGLGLWNSAAATVIVEVAIYCLGIFLYLRTTKAIDRIGKFAFWSFAGLLGVFYILNLVGPPPPSEQAIGWLGLLTWLFVPWAYWIDRHRTLR